jgi:hypothetical protein
MLGSDSFTETDHTLKFNNLEFAYRFPLDYMSNNEPPYTKEISNRLE